MTQPQKTQPSPNRANKIQDRLGVFGICHVSTRITNREFIRLFYCFSEKNSNFNRSPNKIAKTVEDGTLFLVEAEFGQKSEHFADI